MRYDGYAFRQVQNAPLQVTFVAASCEIDTWAKVPTKLARSPRGFQRPVIGSHVKEVHRFFADDETKVNASPTAILIGVDPDFKESIRLLDPDSDEPIDVASIGVKPVRCSVLFDFEPWMRPDLSHDIDLEIETLYASVKADYENAQGAYDSESDDDDEEEEEEDEDLNGGDLDDEEESEGDENGDAEGKSTSELIADEDDTHLVRLSSRQIAEACSSGNYKLWSEAQKRQLLRILKDGRKPGVIMDGQHRIQGTKSLEIPFTVALLPDANWAELAFQFIVNNGTARKVDEGLLINIVGHSLSPDEISLTQTRLYKSGIKVALIQAVMRAHTEDNAFTGMLKFGQPGEYGFLDAAAFQKKIVKLWYGSRGRTGDRPKFGHVKVPERSKWNLSDPFASSCHGSNLLEKAQDWQANRWFEYFRSFWWAVRDRFQPRLWPATYDDWPSRSTSYNENKERLRLMRVTVLGLLQSAVLQHWYQYHQQRLSMHGKDFGSFSISPDDFRKEVRVIVDKVPVEFFTELNYSGFDASKDLRDDLSNQFLNLLSGNKKFADLKSEHRFWKA